VHIFHCLFNLQNRSSVPSPPTPTVQGASDPDFQRELPNCSMEDRVAAINSLLTAHRLQVFVNQETHVETYRAVNLGDAKFRGLDAEHMLVYQVIQSSGNMGIWTRDMKQRTNMAQPKINRILKALEERALVKSVKSVQSASRKVYMLAELTPAKEITGGPWYGTDELDDDFVTTIRNVVLSFIVAQGPVSLDTVAEHIGATGVSIETLAPEDVHHILKTLAYDGDVEEVGVALPNGAEEVQYRAATTTLPTTTHFTSLPCGVCPVFADCHDGGKVSPQTCKYYDEWLDQF
jgi:DNA-directed RNA polymerase III subunit RPC6